MRAKLFGIVILAGVLASAAAFAAKKIIFFTGDDTATSGEKATLTTLQNQAAQPYKVIVRSSPRARLRATPELADYYAGAIPPNYRDGGIDSGTPLHAVYSATNPPAPETLVGTQAIIRNGDIINLAGGGRVTVAVSNNTITVSAYRAPDAGT